EFAIVTDWYTPSDVPKGHAHEQARHQTAGGKPDVPRLPPPMHGLFAAKFNRDGAKNQRHQQQNEREIKPGKNRRVNVRERGEQRAAAGDEPDFVAVPDRADGIDQGAALGVVLREQVQRADAEVEAVEHRVSGEQHTDENEPNRVEIEIHVLGWWVSSVGSASLPDGTKSCSSGPCWILSLSR